MNSQPLDEARDGWLNNKSRTGSISEIVLPLSKKKIVVPKNNHMSFFK